MPQAFRPSRFFMAFCPSFVSGGVSGYRPLRSVMLFDPKPEQYLGRLEARLRRAQAPTAELISDVIAEACVCFAARGGAAKLRIHRLIESGAWTDAALALLELELPQWKLRRIVYEDREWHCALSRHPRFSMSGDIGCGTGPFPASADSRAPPPSRHTGARGHRELWRRSD